MYSSDSAFPGSTENWDGSGNFRDFARSKTGLTKREYIVIEMMKAIISNRQMVEEVEKQAPEHKEEVIAKMAIKYTNALFAEMDKR